MYRHASRYLLPSITWSLIVAAACQADVAVPPARTITINRNMQQLFVDDFLIDRQDELQRTLHQPRKDNGGEFPLIETLKPDETLLPQGKIIYDLQLKRYVMYVIDRWKQIYRLTSKDGMDWVHGEDGQLDPIHIDMPHPGPIPERTYFWLQNHYDARNKKYPYQGWFFGGNWGNDLEGIYHAFSRDGRHWKCGPMVMNAFADKGDPSSHTIHQEGRTLYGPGDATGFSYDSLEDRFLLCIKYFTPDMVPPGNRLRSRTYAYIDRLDQPFDVSRMVARIDQLPPAANKGGNKPFDEFYYSLGWRCGTMWIGFLDVWHLKNDYPWSAAGCMFKKLMSSRDGLHWETVPFDNDDGIPEVWIANGPEGGNNARNDGGYIYNFGGGPLRIGDEYIFYYGGSSYGKNPPEREKRITGGGIFRARLRVDGYVSVDGGSLTTHPLAFEGQDLYVNGMGPITVAVLDDANKMLACAYITGDSLQHQVRFAGRSLRGIAPRGVARLRFHVNGAGSLFAFTIR